MRFLSPRDHGYRIGNSGSRTTVTAADDTKVIQEKSLNGYAGESHDSIEHFSNYGFTHVVQPPTGEGDQAQTAEAAVMYMGSNRSHGISVANGDRRYRLYKLANGEVAMHDDQGQQVHFRRDGIWGSVPNSKQVKLQIMDDDKMPQDPNAQPVNGQKLGQIQQAGRPAAINITLDKNQFTINHPSGTVNINCANLNYNVSGNITEIAGGGFNIKGAHVHTVGKTYLGVDQLNESPSPIVPCTSGAPAKQTFVKIG